MSGQIAQLQANLDAARQQQNQIYNALSGQMANLTSAQATGLQQVNQSVTSAEQSLYSAIQYTFYQIPNRYKAIWGT